MRQTVKRRGVVAVGTMAAASMVGLAVSGGVSSAASPSASRPHASSKIPGAYGSIPTQSGKPVSGPRTLSYAEQPGAGPNYIFPITPVANSSVYTAYQFQYLMWRPLYWAPTGAVPKYDASLSLANPPKFSDGNRTVTITLKPGYKWSDGAPVTADDVIFSIDVTKAAVKESASNWGNYTPGLFPDNVASAVAAGKNTVVLHLTKTYNPGWFYDNELSLIIPIPAHAWAKASASGPTLNYAVPANAKKIYDFLNAQSKDLSGWASNPLWQVVDGPYHLTSYTASNNGATLSANSSYGGVYKPHIQTVQLVPFTSTAAEFNQLRSGNIDVGYVDFSDIPQIPTLARQGYNYFGLPDFGFEYMAFNFKDKTGDWNNIVGQLYVRQALAMLEDEPAYVSGIFKGAAVEAYGVVPKYPVSPYAPYDALHPLYPFSTSKAKSLLTSHGWKMVKGTMTCESAACGKGIPVGTKLAFNIDYGNSPAVIGQQVDAWASAAASIGIKITANSHTFNYLLQTDNNPSAPANVNKWAMVDFGGFTNSIYPTTNTLFNTTGSYNLGSFSDPKLDQLINNSVFGGNPAAVTKELAYVSKVLPGIFQPAPDEIYAWKNTVSGPQKAFTSMTQYFFNPEELYFTK